MSESDYIASRDSENGLPLSHADDLVQRLEGRTATPEREGLPRSYRMRADAHYVEQLGSPAQPVIRLVAVGLIECRDLPSADAVVPLTQSIAAHGVLQPLLVRRQGARYTLIAGRKRLAAAMAAKLNAVPCLLHDAEGASAAALSEAENLRVDGAAPNAVDSQQTLRSQLEVLASDLSAIETSLSLLTSSRQGGLPQKVGADLIGSQTARAAWLVRSMLATFEDSRLVPLGAIVQRVADSFEAHRRLISLQLECSVTAAAAVWQLPEDSATAAITGALFAALSSLDDVAKPRIELHADTTPARGLKIEVLQRAVRVSPRLGQFRDQDVGARAEELIPSLALRLAQSVAAAHGGSAELSALPGVGSVLQITFGTTQAIT